VFYDFLDNFEKDLSKPRSLFFFRGFSISRGFSVSPVRVPLETSAAVDHVTVHARGAPKSLAENC
jgi:hypothetical protein